MALYSLLIFALASWKWPHTESCLKQVLNLTATPALYLEPNSRCAVTWLWDVRIRTHPSHTVQNTWGRPSRFGVCHNGVHTLSLHPPFCFNKTATERERERHVFLQTVSSVDNCFAISIQVFFFSLLAVFVGILWRISSLTKAPLKYSCRLLIQEPDTGSGLVEVKDQHCYPRKFLHKNAPSNFNNTPHRDLCEIVQPSPGDETGRKTPPCKHDTILVSARGTKQARTATGSCSVAPNHRIW